jgi:hypothetical protein
MICYSLAINFGSLQNYTITQCGHRGTKQKNKIIRKINTYTLIQNEILLVSHGQTVLKQALILVIIFYLER